MSESANNDIVAAENPSGPARLSGGNKKGVKIDGDGGSSDLSPGLLTQFLRSTFGYRKTSLSLLISITFVLILTINYITTSVSLLVSLPTDDLETDLLDSSWYDLQKISKIEHPYDSHGNDYVHDYLYSKISHVIRDKNYIEFDNDLNYTNNVLFDRKETFNSSSNYGSIIYYESNNLLVKVNGRRKDLPALLLSAHFDSVPTGFGTTDDGMGISSLMGVLAYYGLPSTKQPLRTIVFNFNNNEEFGLLGASSFFNHPYSENVGFFINLEGTGAGGLAYLFRGTDYNIIKYYAQVRYPLGSSIFQQGFSSGLIHSETDYKVYTNHGLRGLDVAFIKPRDYYHTKHDSISMTTKKSLWHMLSNTLDFVKIISEENDIEEKEENSVYGNVFSFFFSFPISTVYVANIVALTIFPLLNLFLLLIVYKKSSWNISFAGFIRYPISLIISISINGILWKLFLKLNPLIPSLNYMAPLITLFSSFILSNYLVLNFFETVNESHDEKLIIIIYNSFIAWILLFTSTIGMTENNAAHVGEFSLAFIFVILSASASFGLLGLSFKPSLLKHNHDEETTPLLSGSDNNHSNAANDDISYGSGDSINDSTTEQNQSDLEHSGAHSLKSVKSKFQSFCYDWSFQYLILVPLPALIIVSYGDLILEGINQTSQESWASTRFVWLVIDYWGLVLSLLVLPFVSKFNKYLSTSLVIILLCGWSFITLCEPFDQSHPLKLRFIETIDIDQQSPEAIVGVLGVKGYIADVLNDLPSVKETSVDIECKPLNDGLENCFYKGSKVELINNFSGNYNDYLNISVLKNSSDNKGKPYYEPLFGELIINTPKNRNCVVTFNKTRTEGKESPVKAVIIYQDHNITNSSHIISSEQDLQEAMLMKIPEGYSKDSQGNDVYKLIKGINEVQLHKLSWDRPYHIGFQWIPSLRDFEFDSEVDNDNILGVSVDCYWGEHDNSIQHEKPISKIPDYEELLQYSPNYISWSNQAKGLVVVKKYIEV